MDNSNVRDLFMRAAGELMWTEDDEEVPEAIWHRFERLLHDEGLTLKLVPSGEVRPGDIVH